ncbi:MAG: MBL fold metallo-hydrolase [Archaeoglobales archaeon]|nr:MBL fold metallo-hydrolase [Archaeoglobales archaeon]
MGIKVAEDFYLLKPGKVVFDESGAILYASSSVSLILEPLIVVDTGLPIDQELIIDALQELSLKPSEIDLVINTHLHPDHCGCNEIFYNAKIYAHPLEILRTGANYLPCPKKISERVEIIETPGHIDGHISVVFDNIVVAGDAIPTKDNYLKRVIPRLHTNAEKAKESMEKIIRIAKIIIPGHDQPIYL